MVAPRSCLRRLRRPLALVALGTLLPLLASGGTAGAVLRSAGPAGNGVGPAGAPPRTAAPAPVRLSATAAVLMDARSGQVLYAHNPHLIWPPASTTKIMTALVALRSLPLETPILISPEVARFREGSVVGLPAGARIPLRDLLYALLLPSGNDVALAIAEGVAGSVPAFVARMNAEAERLGAKDTHFTSPHGLYHPAHYSTAYDLALITRAAMQHETFREIVRTRQWTLALPGRGPRILWNHNRFLSRYAGADGVKTGYVHQSGQTLVASASRGGWQLIAVVLHTGDLWGDPSRLLSFGFAHYRSVELAFAGEQLAAVDVPGASDPVPGVVPAPVFGALGQGEVAVRRVSVVSHLELPVQQGEQVGEADFYASGRLVGSTPLVAPKTVEPHTGFLRVVDWMGRMVNEFSGGTAQ